MHMPSLAEDVCVLMLFRGAVAGNLQCAAGEVGGGVVQAHSRNWIIVLVKPCLTEIHCLTRVA